MAEFANKTGIILHGGIAAIVIDATGDNKFSSALAGAGALGDLARLKYTIGHFRGEIVLDTNEACVIEVNLVNGSTVVESVSVACDGLSASYGFALADIDLSNIPAASQLGLRVDVTTQAATASNKCHCFAVLDVTHPIIIG